MTAENGKALDTGLSMDILQKQKMWGGVVVVVVVVYFVSRDID
jgi:hypothetical protein